MAIAKILEFAKDGLKSIAGLSLDAGFPREEKPAREWFNYLFNLIFLKLNELVDEVNQLRSDVDSVNRRLKALTAGGTVVPPDPDAPIVTPPTTTPSAPVTPPAPPKRFLWELRVGSTQSFASGATPTVIGQNAAYKNQPSRWVFSAVAKDSNGVTIEDREIARGSSVTDGTGKMTVTLPSCPAPATFKAGTAKVIYTLNMSGDEYDSANYNSNSVRIDNGVVLTAGVIAPAGRLAGNDSRLWSK